MRDEQIKELISAYIDDELSVDERSLIERHLADSIESRQFLDQLQRQRTALRKLPRLKLRDDFSQRVLAAIENAAIETARPAFAPTPVSDGRPLEAESLEVGPGTRSAWWKTWQGISTGIATVAALVLIALFLTRSGNNRIGPRPNDLVGNGKIPPQESPQPRPEDMRLPEKLGPPVQPGVGESLPPAAALALGEFQKFVQFVFVYDITLTPAAQQKNLFESWMRKAGIPVHNGIRLDQKLENAILAARFVQAAKIAPVGKDQRPADGTDRDEVEMLFVRGLNKHIDAVWQEFIEVRAGPANPGVQMKIDMVVAPEDLYIFMQLNKATGLDVAGMKSSPAILREPVAFPLQFQQSMQSLAAVKVEPVDMDTALAMVTDSESGSFPLRAEPYSGDEFALAQAERSTLLVAQGAVAPAAPPVPAGFTGRDEPTQAIFIIRRLKEDPNANVN